MKLSLYPQNTYDKHVGLQTGPSHLFCAICKYKCNHIIVHILILSTKIAQVENIEMKHIFKKNT